MALVHKGKPVAGAVFNPAKDEFFEAKLGDGAYLNGNPISVSEKTELTEAHFFSGKKVFEYHGWDKLAPKAHFGHVNSIAYRMVLVAMGKYDASLSLRPKSDWDIAAADIILTEAGGVNCMTDGSEISYNKEDIHHRNVISCSKALHPLLMDMFTDYQMLK